MDNLVKVPLANTGATPERRACRSFMERLAGLFFAGMVAALMTSAATTPTTTTTLGLSASSTLSASSVSTPAAPEKKTPGHQQNLPVKNPKNQKHHKTTHKTLDSSGSTQTASRAHFTQFIRQGSVAIPPCAEGAEFLTKKTSPEAAVELFGKFK